MTILKIVTLIDSQTVSEFKPSKNLISGYPLTLCMSIILECP
jgi:hypothetical protein